MIEGSVVIGHGPSLINAGMGEFIDSFRYVLRLLHGGDWQEVADYGTRTSFYCGTVGKFRRREVVDLPETGFIIWSKRGPLPDKCRSEFEEYFGFVDLTASVQSQRDYLGWSRYLSSGAAAVIAAATVIKKPVTVLGCDNLKAGDNHYKYYIGSAQYSGREPAKAHNYKAERKVIDNLQGVSIDFL